MRTVASSQVTPHQDVQTQSRTREGKTSFSFTLALRTPRASLESTISSYLKRFILRAKQASKLRAIACVPYRRRPSGRPSINSPVHTITIEKVVRNSYCRMIQKPLQILKRMKTCVVGWYRSKTPGKPATHTGQTQAGSHRRYTICRVRTGAPVRAVCEPCVASPCVFLRF